MGELSELKTLAAIAAHAAVKAGKEILAVYDRDFTIEFKEDSSPLTEADKASHAAIKKLVPQLSSEELQGFVDYLEPLFIDVN